MYFIEKYVLISTIFWLDHCQDKLLRMMEISAIFFVIDIAISFFIKQIPSAYLFCVRILKNYW